MVCRKCARWNLSPVEERWEAIEEAERAYRDTKKRVATDNIGLARLNDGTELVRIGKPMLPEFAAWRYGDQLGRRRRRRLAIGVSAGIVGGAAVAGVGFGIASLTSFSTMTTLLGLGIPQLYMNWSFSARRLTIAGTNGERMLLPSLNLASSTISLSQAHPTIPQTLSVYFSHLLPKKTWSMPFISPKWVHEINSRRVGVSYSGDEAARVLTIILAATNGYAGADQTVRAAVQSIENAPDPVSLLNSLSPDEKARSQKRIVSPHLNLMIIKELPVHLRLALEMSLNEESERRALNGELAELENRWKQAEEIAAIADGLFVADGTSNKLDAMRD